MPIPKEYIDSVVCEKCKGEIFQVLYKLGKVSAFKLNTMGVPNPGKDMLTQSPIYKCVNCGEITDPQQLQGSSDSDLDIG